MIPADTLPVLASDRTCMTVSTSDLPSETSTLGDGELVSALTSYGGALASFASADYKHCLGRECEADHE